MDHKTAVREAFEAGYRAGYRWWDGSRHEPTPTETREAYIAHLESQVAERDVARVHVDSSAVTADLLRR